MLITLSGAEAVMPLGKARIPEFLDSLNQTIDLFGITTARRVSAFLAQIAHESGELRYTLEIASGDAYEDRKDLGNIQSGDGRRYKGRGLIQITGRANYAACGHDLGLPLLEFPEMLEAPNGACLSAGWFWAKRGLNSLSDADKFGAITKVINGGYNGLDDRLMYWLRARKAFGL